MINDLIDNLSLSEKRSISRCISIIENSDAPGNEFSREIFKRTGKAYRIGITGPPGAGKSTITNQLTKLILANNKSVGIIAIDPTSPFTGGSILGDRIRMNEIGMEPKVYIRSMASRGSMGGLSRKAVEAADVLDAAGFDYIIFETVGVGQSELDIARAADTTVVVLVPESGDSVQAMKAGLMEIADVFAFNKSDRPGADNAIAALKSIMQLNQGHNNAHKPEIVKTIATENTGIASLISEITKHESRLKESGELKRIRLEHNKIRVKNALIEKFNSQVWNEESSKILEEKLIQLADGNHSPEEVAEDIFDEFVNKFARQNG